MSDALAPLGRRERLLERLDFSWGASGSLLRYIGERDLWMERFRPGGPHGLWICGHLTHYEAGALNIYRGIEGNPRPEWKELFGNGSECSDDRDHYPDAAGILQGLNQGRAAVRDAIAEMTEADLDRPVTNERLRIRDIQSQIEFLIWHDAHHAAQLGAIVNTYKQNGGG